MRDTLSEATLAAATLDTLIAQYRIAASRHHEATVHGDHISANRSHELLAAAYRELRRRGGDAQRQLLPLLAEDDYGVRMWAAAHALEFAPDEGRRALERLVSEPGIAGFTARITLESWAAGTLRFP